MKALGGKDMFSRGGGGQCYGFGGVLMAAQFFSKRSKFILVAVPPEADRV